jgi:cytochrome c-type biogenesis protein CcmH/NrfG
MVAKLESRVNAGNPSIDDVIMLARSYRVLSRDEESITLYRKAQEMAPEDPAIKLVLASALVRSENEGYRGEGEKIVDELLVTDPKKPEALWLKSIGLVRRHEIDAARKTLTQLSEIVTENSDAKNAVTGLLKELETATTSEGKSSPTPATPVPDVQPGTENK